jgi:hypothetical protein
MVIKQYSGNRPQRLHIAYSEPGLRNTQYATRTRVSLSNLILHLFLIASVGLINPLVYIKPHSPHELSAPVYRLSIFKDAGRGAELAQLRQRLLGSETALPLPPVWGAPRPAIGAQSAIPVLAQGAQNMLGHPCTGLDASGLDVPICPFSQVWDIFSIGSSIDLPPPKKPPPGVS